ncbi:MAG TPA: hypothetical protein VFG30_05540, partial [Polyangiales bacterium]|nr:hypothetical protein [Polyangiales bacterium]
MSQLKPHAQAGDDLLLSGARGTALDSAPDLESSSRLARHTGRFAHALVVDDDDALRRSLVRFLRGMHTEVS